MLPLPSDVPTANARTAAGSNRRRTPTRMQGSSRRSAGWRELPSRAAQPQFDVLLLMSSALADVSSIPLDAHRVSSALDDVASSVYTTRRERAHAATDLARAWVR